MSEAADKALAEATAALGKEEAKEEVVVKDDKPVDKPADNPEIEEATKLGWKPEKEFEGEDGWVDAGEFLRRKPLFDAIHKEKRKNKKSQERMEALVGDINAQKKAAVDQALAEINQAKKVAVAEGDTDMYNSLDKQEKDTVYTPVPEVAVNTAFDKWQESNDWYDDDMQLTRYADGYATELRNLNPDMPEAEMYEKVETEVKATFPTKFSNPARQRAPAVEGTTAPAKGGRKAEGKITFSDLPEDAKTVYKLLVKSKNNPRGIRTSEEFLDSYQERGGELIQKGA